MGVFLDSLYLKSFFFQVIKMSASCMQIVMQSHHLKIHKCMFMCQFWCSVLGSEPFGNTFWTILSHGVIAHFSPCCQYVDPQPCSMPPCPALHHFSFTKVQWALVCCCALAGWMAWGHRARPCSRCALGSQECQTSASTDRDSWWLRVQCAAELSPVSIVSPPVSLLA